MTLTTFLAGLALMTISSLVNGLMPMCSSVAGLRTTLICNRPGTAKLPGPSLPRFLADQLGKFIEQAADLLLGQARGFGQGSQDFRFVHGFLLNVASIVHSFNENGPANVRGVGGAS